MPAKKKPNAQGVAGMHELLGHWADFQHISGYMLTFAMDMETVKGEHKLVVRATASGTASGPHSEFLHTEVMTWPTSTAKNVLGVMYLLMNRCDAAWDAYDRLSKQAPVGV